MALKRGILVAMQVHGTGRDEARWPDVAPAARVVQELFELAGAL
jgi:hypothetical protein